VGCVDLVHWAKRSSVTTVINFPVPHIIPTAYFLSSWAVVGFSRMIQPHGVKYG